MNRKVSVNTKPNLTSEDNPGLAGYARANGRGGGMVKVFPHAHASPEDVATTVAARDRSHHPEAEHRPSPRADQRADPVWSVVEEGRADFIAHGRKSPGAYADDDPEFKPRVQPGAAEDARCSAAEAEAAEADLMGAVGQADISKLARTL